jgi:hypothetical protein
VSIEQDLLRKLFGSLNDWTDLTETDGGVYLVTEVRVVLTEDEAEVVRELRKEARL